MSQFSAEIKIDNLTNEKCCHFKNSILNIDNKNFNLLVPNNYFSNLPKQIYLKSSPEEPLILKKIENYEENTKNITCLNGIWVIISKYVSTNAGHVLGDEVFAIWQALSVFNLQNKDINIITNNYDIHIQQYKCLTKNKLFSFEEFKNKYFKFENLIVGMSRNGYALGFTNLKNDSRLLKNRASYLPDFTNTVNKFREHTFKIFDINNTNINNKIKTILILDKDEKVADHKCKLYEINNIINFLKEKYNNYNIKKICWNGMSIKDQVNEIAFADIIISLPGSDLMNCIFLNPKSYIICPNRFYKNGKKENSNEIDIWFRHTHKCLEITDVTIVYKDNKLYSKINDLNMLFRIIDNIINNNI